MDEGLRRAAATSLMSLCLKLAFAFTQLFFPPVFHDLGSRRHAIKVLFEAACVSDPPLTGDNEKSTRARRE